MRLPALRQQADLVIRSSPLRHGGIYQTRKHWAKGISMVIEVQSRGVVRTDTRHAVGRRGGAVIAALASISLLAGCGAAGSSGSSDSGGGKLGTLTVIMSSSHSFHSIALEVGNQLGAWKGTGLTVKVVGGTSPSVTTAMASGHADIGDQSGNTVAANIAKGTKATIVAAQDYGNDQAVVVSNRSKAKSLRDLKGARFGLSGFGSEGDFVTSKMAESFGWSANDYKKIPLGDVKSLTAALTRGSIDAFAFNPMVAAQVQAEGKGRIVGYTGRFVAPIAGDCFYVRDSVLKDRPDAVKAFFEGYFRTVKYLKSHRSKIRDIVVNDWGNNPKAYDLVAKEMTDTISSDGKISTPQLQGLDKSVAFAFPQLKNVDATKYYRYWKEIS